MCGFVGYLSLNAKNADKEIITKISNNYGRNALKTIKRRGPDAEGEWSNNLIWLGHRRLSIVDTSTRGLQPMEYGDYVIAYNGMIYNFKALKTKLIKKGYKFYTETDTEVILAGWTEWQENLFTRFKTYFER